jgi:putative addiction module component (TIGR02574 family)
MSLEIQSLRELENTRQKLKGLQSLRPPGVCSDMDLGFERELERRVADYDSGKTEASDWDDVASRLREALEQKDSS